MILVAYYLGSLSAECLAITRMIQGHEQLAVTWQVLALLCLLVAELVLTKKR